MATKCPNCLIDIENNRCKGCGQEFYEYDN